MYLFRNTMSRDEATRFIELCNNIGVYDDAEEGPRVYVVDRVARDGYPYSKVTAYCYKPQFDVLAANFKTKGKVYN